MESDLADRLDAGPTVRRPFRDLKKAGYGSGYRV